MTASMILWTLEFLDWIRDQLVEGWPGVKLRGGAPDITPDPYRIRFRKDGKQYWLVLSPEAITNTGVSDVASLLESSDWIPTLQRTGGISVHVHEPMGTKPLLIPWPPLGPEVKVEAHA
jgi:hypothetical protein